MSSSSSLDLDLKQLQAYLPQAALALAAGYGLYIAYQGYRYIFPYTVLQKLPGPSNGHPLLGNMREIFKAENGSAHKKWMEDHGHVVAYREFLNVCAHISHTMYLHLLAILLFHRRMYMQQLTTVLISSVPAFSPPTSVPSPTSSSTTTSIRSPLLSNVASHPSSAGVFSSPRVNNTVCNARLSTLPSDLLSFGRRRGCSSISQMRYIIITVTSPYQVPFEYSYVNGLQLRDILSAASIKGNEAATVDVVPFLTRATMDIIGLAGFGYTFNSLTHPEQTNELEAAFTGAFSAAQSAPIMAMLNMLVPGFRQLVSIGIFCRLDWNDKTHVVKYCSPRRGTSRR
jgi:hypothetical protein